MTVLAGRETRPGVTRAGPGERRGWLGVLAVTAAVAASWAPFLTAPFGDNHLGRVIARYALHMRNLHQDGLVGSDLSAAWAPYRPPRTVALQLPAEAGPDDLVVLDLTRVPAWLPDPIPSPPVAQTGRYALFRVAELRELAGPEGI